MSDKALEQVLESWKRIDCPAPRWLEERKAPDFDFIQTGAEGPVVLFLHGLFGALSNWDSTLPLIAKYCRCTALQFPILTGHKSEVKVKALTLYAEYFIRQKGLGPVVLCGNSLGGHVALRLALNSPELVRGLLLSGSSGLYEHTVDTLPIRPGESFIREHMAKVFYNKSFITDQAVNEILAILSSRARQLNLINSARSAKRDYMEDLLSQIKSPTLLLWGENDEVTDLEVARLFQQKMPDAELVTVANCGHAPMIEHPQWFADQVKLYMQRRKWIV